VVDVLHRVSSLTYHLPYPVIEQVYCNGHVGVGAKEFGEKENTNQFNKMKVHYAWRDG
jgi:hypothetical protein